MDKDSDEYRLWRAYVIGLALTFITIAACMAFFVPEGPPPQRFSPGLVFLIGGMFLWPVAAVTGYFRAQAMYQKRMSGWTPLELNPREGFFTSRLIKLIQKIRGK